jgi:hypothetical protein
MTAGSEEAAEADVPTEEDPVKVHIRSLALTMAIIASILTLVLGIWYSATGYGAPMVNILVSLYAGIAPLNYEPLKGLADNMGQNAISTLLLTVFSFVDGAILGVVSGFLYNLLAPEAKAKD